MFDPCARLLWTSTKGGWGSTLTADQQSGAIDVRDVTDLWLAVAVTGPVTGTTPTLDVTLELRDGASPPNWFPAVLTVPQLTAVGRQHVSGGLHIAGNALVLPDFVRVVADVGGTTPSFAATTVSLFGR